MSAESVDLAWFKTEAGAALAHGNELVETLFSDIRDWTMPTP
ncbi:hypothetical protein [Microbacterium sp. 4-7]|nr:hypothetical protein [Microbacterium sp. 4-7]